MLIVILTEQDFGLRYIQDNSFYGNYMFYSNGNLGINNYALRPVITLSADIKIKQCTGENRPTNMHQIVW